MAGTMAEKASNTTGRTPSVLVPPINFSLVSRGVYRSGHPNRKNFPFLLGLSLKTIIYLESTTYRPDSQSFIDSSAVKLHTYDLSDESKLFSSEGKRTIDEILRLVLDTRNHPILVHESASFVHW
jgi:tyrosine-protein phosphatase SIW14